MIQFRYGVTIFWLIFAAWGIVACGSAPPPATPTPIPTAQIDPDEPVELVVWGWDETLKNHFETLHPNVTVRMDDQGWDQELYQNLLNALQVGNPPDVVIGESYFRSLAAAGELLPLDDVLGDIKTDMIPGTYKGAVYGDKIYGVSSFTGVFVFERNCEVITKAGLNCDNPPATWDELLTQAAQITEKGQGEYYGYSLQGPEGPATGGVFRISVYLSQLDALMCKNNCTEPDFNNPQALPVLEFIRELNRYTPPGLTFNPDEGQVYTQLFEGKSAYQIAGSWHPNWAKEAGCQDCRYSAVPIPAGGHPASIIVGNVIYAALSQSKHPDLAMEFVKMVASPDMQARVYPELGRLPSTYSALTTLRAEVGAADQTFIDELLTNKNLNVLPQWIKEPQKLWRIYNELLKDVLSTERPIQEIMDEAQSKADNVMQN